ncbi:MAG TPA: hypothetical protein VMV81_00135 [Phycisphaerae bacterium]|nr:hypothetical protein [Phycisphaerae bacterium]
MPIVASCKCGKKFKVKDELAGKAVKCPSCGSGIRIPSAGGGKSASPVAKAAVDAEAALLRFEEAQKKKAKTAEEEAAIRAEQNKLIASYDQIAGKTAKPGEKKEKGKLGEGPPKKATIFTKIADAFGAMFSSFAFKYIFIAVVGGGAVFGSVKLVQYMTSYVSSDVKPQMPKEQRVRELMDQAEKLCKEKKYHEATPILEEIISLDPKKDMNHDYQRMKKEVMESGT